MTLPAESFEERKNLATSVNSHKRVFMAVANFTMGATRERLEYKVFLIESFEEAMHCRLQHLDDKISIFISVSGYIHKLIINGRCYS